jgi:hypothetical protein
MNDPLKPADDKNVPGPGQPESTETDDCGWVCA